MKSVICSADGFSWCILCKCALIIDFLMNLLPHFLHANIRLPRCTHAWSTALKQRFLTLAGIRRLHLLHVIDFAPGARLFRIPRHRYLRYANVFRGGSLKNQAHKHLKREKVQRLLECACNRSSPSRTCRSCFGIYRSTVALFLICSFISSR